MKRLLLMLVLLWPVAGLAAFWSGNKIQEDCFDTKVGEANANVYQYNICVSFLVGIADAVGTFSGWGYKDKDGALYGSCIPHDVRTEQLRQVWLEWAREHSGDLHRAAAREALNAFENAWPCER
jgi:hypothetical protein